MKAVPILVITNALAIGLAVMALTKDSGDPAARTSSRATTARNAASGNDYYDTEIAEPKKEIARLSGERMAQPKKTPVTDGGENPASEPGKAIDRSMPELDKNAVMASPEFEEFRAKVRIAEEVNEREDRINREVDRLDQLIAENKIGSLSGKQKKVVAEELLAYREKTRLIWRGLRQREDLQNVPQEQRREAWRNAYREEQTKIKAESQKELENVMPAADVEEIMSSGDGGWGGRSRRR